MDIYKTLVNILDEIRKDAKSNVDLYIPENGKTNLVNSRSRALIHFFLKSYFGILDFNERELIITDGPQDGGIDAYYISESDKKIYLIQTKFREDSSKYKNAEIKNEDLWKMDLNSVIKKVSKKDEKGISYNKEIITFQNKLKKIKNISEYEYVVIIVANLNSLQKKHIISTHFTKDFKIEIFDYLRVYRQLLLPYVQDDFFNEDKLSLKMLLSNKENDNKKPIKYKVKTEYGDCNMNMFLVPTEEIAKATSKYKNSILKYNPRTYLGMQTKGVNSDIENSILKKDTNDFLLLNNGITILATKVTSTEFTGKKGVGEITILDPQIINGGQTSFALSHIYERFNRGEIKKNPFIGKEVLLKVIEQVKKDEYDKITSSVSLATNNQSAISLGDLKSNHDSQVKIQNYIFENFGLYYERKRGEFLNSVTNSYIKKEQIIMRTDFIRTSYSSEFPLISKNPKNISEKGLFSYDVFKILSETSKYKKYVLSYLVYREVQKIKRQSLKSQDKWSFSFYGNALRYGDLAVTMISTNKLKNEDWDKDKKIIVSTIHGVLTKWKDFEQDVFSEVSNLVYFNKNTLENNQIGYYKSDNLIKDLVKFLSKFN